MQTWDYESFSSELNSLFSLLKQYNSFVEFDSPSLLIPIEYFNDFSRTIENVFSERLLPKNTIATLEQRWRRIFSQKYKLLKKLTHPGIAKAIQEKLQEIEARMLLLLTFVVQYKFNYVLKKFRYRGYKVLVIHRSREIACIEHDDRKPLLVLREDVPQQFYEPILEHEIAELEFNLQFSDDDPKRAHEQAGVPAGRKKAAELGILEEFLAFEREHQIS